MRGRPLIQWLIFLVLWTALVLPVWRVTRGVRSHTGRSVERELVRSDLWVSLRFSQQPQGFSLAQGVDSVWVESDPGGMEFERVMTLARDSRGLELGLTAELGDGMTAVEITIEGDGLSPRSRTVWAEGSVEEYVNFSWGDDAASE